MCVLGFEKTSHETKSNRLPSRESKITYTSNATVGAEQIAQVDMDLKEKAQRQAINDKLQRYFYGLVATNKKLLGIKHLGYYVNTNQMFSHVTSKGIAVEEWPKFVGDEMSQHPEKWKDEAQIKKIQDLITKRGGGRPFKMYPMSIFLARELRKRNNPKKLLVIAKE